MALPSISLRMRCVMLARRWMLSCLERLCRRVFESRVTVSRWSRTKRARWLWGSLVHLSVHFWKPIMTRSRKGILFSPTTPTCVMPLSRICPTGWFWCRSLKMVGILLGLRCLVICLIMVAWCQVQFLLKRRLSFKKAFVFHRLNFIRKVFCRPIYWSWFYIMCAHHSGTGLTWTRWSLPVTPPPSDVSNCPYDLAMMCFSRPWILCCGVTMTPWSILLVCLFQKNPEFLKTTSVMMAWVWAPIKLSAPCGVRATRRSLILVGLILRLRVRLISFWTKICSKCSLDPLRLMLLIHRLSLTMAFMIS